MTKRFYNRDILAPGKLLEFYHRIVMHEEKLNINSKLSSTELMAIANAYAIYYVESGITSTGFDRCREFVQYLSEKNSDLSSFLLLMYLKARGDYWVPDSKTASGDSALCGAVPLPLLGIRNRLGISYSSWAYAVEDNPLKSYYGDLLLGHTFTSTTLNGAGNPEYKSEYGLLMAHTAGAVDWSDLQINHMRGNLKHSIFRAPKISEEEGLISKEEAELYNSYSLYLRLLTIQHWAFAPHLRSTNMILDIDDWDAVPRKVGAGEFIPLQNKGKFKIPGIEGSPGVSAEDFKMPVVEVYEPMTLKEMYEKNNINKLHEDIKSSSSGKSFAQIAAEGGEGDK